MTMNKLFFENLIIKRDRFFPFSVHCPLVYRVSASICLVTMFLLVSWGELYCELLPLELFPGGHINKSKSCR